MDILEINDIALSLYRQGQHIEHLCLVHKQDNGLLFDQQALAGQRLAPSQCASGYWHHLSLEPLNLIGELRHTADLAHRQLLALAQQVGPSPVLVAVPGNLNQAQLALLLGIMRETPWQVTGLIYTALGSLVNRVDSGMHLHVALHSKHIVLTELSATDSLSHSNYQLLSGIGLDSLCDYLMKHLAKRYIHELRFDPMHQGNTEQALYLWVRQYCLSGQRMPLSIANRTLPLDDSELPRRIQQFMAPLLSLLTSHPNHIWLAHHLARLPGLTATLPQAKVLDANAVLDAAALVLPSQAAEGVNLIDTLPRASQVEALPLATHLLYEDHALALQEGNYGWQNNQLIHSPTETAFSIQPYAEGHRLIPCGNWHTSQKDSEAALKVGDYLSLSRGDISRSIRCIRVMP